MVEILLPGSDQWQDGSAFARSGVPVAQAVGALVRYPTGNAAIVTKVTGISEPDATGRRHLLMEMHTPEVESDANVS